MLDQTEIETTTALEAMGSYETEDTGIRNTIFISPRAGARHSAQIRVALDPPQSFDPCQGTTASIAVHNGEVTAGTIPPDLLRQLYRFLDLNRKTLLDYWDYKISTTAMKRRLQPIGG